MNTKFALVALAALAAAPAASAEDRCATANGELTKLVATTFLKAGTNYDTCKLATSSKFSLFPIIGVPSDDVLAVMCATPACSAAFKEILAKATTLLDCISFNASSGAEINFLRFMTNYDASCGQFTPAPTTPAPTTPAPTTPAPTTPAPTTPAPTTPAPTTITPGTPMPSVTPTTPEPTLPKPSC